MKRGTRALILTGGWWLTTIAAAEVIVIADSPAIAEAALLTAAVLGFLCHGTALVLGLWVVIRPGTSWRVLGIASIALALAGTLAAVTCLLAFLDSYEVSHRLSH